MADSLPLASPNPEKDPNQFWGYRAKDLRSSGLGHLVPPGVPDDARTTQVGGISRLDYTEWTTSPVVAPPETPAEPAPVQPSPQVEVVQPSPRRKRGGQPGNLNSLKHGLYLDQSRLRNTTPIESAILFDVSEMITNLKDYLNFTYQAGLKTKSLGEMTETLRALSFAAMGITRLISTHSQHITTYLPDSVADLEASSIFELVKHYKSKLEHMGGDVDLDLRTDHD